MISAADRARQAQAVAEIFDLMRKRGLVLDDLAEIGGQDLESSNSKQFAKAHSVEKTWALMARLSVKFADLEQAPGQPPTKSARRRRGEGVFSEVIENKEISGDTPSEVKSLKTNNKTDDHSVEVSGGRWKHKRQLVPGGAGGTPLQPAWSTVSSYALGRLPVIPGVERLIILVDHDEAGLTASGTCMDRWIRAGRSVIRLKPKRAGADFNDLVMESAA